LQWGNSPQAQLAAPKLVAQLWTTQYAAVCSAELERQQAGASQHPPKKRQQAAALQSAAPQITNALRSNKKTALQTGFVHIGFS
jgi:hypothetical protein